MHVAYDCHYIVAIQELSRLKSKSKHCFTEIRKTKIRFEIAPRIGANRRLAKHRHSTQLPSMSAAFVKHLAALRLNLREAGGIVTRIVSALIVVLLLSTTFLGADPEPYLKSAPMPFYPALARQARIEGKVTLRFVVNEQGDTSAQTVPVLG